MIKLDTRPEVETQLPKSIGVPVSVLIPAKNEEHNIADCINSVSWANQIVVIDSGSMDGTAEIAVALGAEVVQFRYQTGGLKKKNWALENCHFDNEWILIIDADERATPELAVEIAQALRSPGSTVGYYLNRRFFFLGKWIRHSGYYPSWNLRLFRKQCGQYEKLTDKDAICGDNEVHEHVLLDGPSAKLTNPLDHFAYPSVEVFVEKHNRYSNWEAIWGTRLSIPVRQNGQSKSRIVAIFNLKRTLKRLARRIPAAHWLRFAYHYYLRLGFADGMEGYIFCHLLAEYEFLIWAKARGRNPN